MIFVDTSAWYAATVPNDEDHAAARAFLAANPASQLFTIDYVVDELLTLCKSRGEFVRGARLGRRLFSGEAARVDQVSFYDIAQAWELFQSYDDKAWSFTDCVSKAVIERLGITQAFAFDEHFRQFGDIEVVP